MEPVNDVWAADIIREAKDRANRQKLFNPHQIRVSSNSSCATLVLAKATGLVTDDIPWDYSARGHRLEGEAGARLRAIYPDTQEQVSVPTSAAGTWTHPDVFIPSLSLGIQIKSCDRRLILEHGDGFVGDLMHLPKEYQVDQALLEWYFWRQTGWCMTQKRGRMAPPPERYELLYIGQDDHGASELSIPVEWDGDRAQALADEFARRVELLKWGEVPARTKTSPDWECGRVRKWYAWDGAYDQQSLPCPMYERCWGREYEPNYTTRVPKKGWSRTR